MTARKLRIITYCLNLLTDIVVSVPTYLLFWSNLWVFSIPLPPLMLLGLNALILRLNRRTKFNRACLKLRVAGLVILNALISYGIVAALTLVINRLTGFGL